MPFTSNPDLLDGAAVYAGQIADSNDYSTRTYYNAETAAVIPFGYGVVLGTAANADKTFAPGILPAAASTNFLGVAVKTEGIEYKTGTAGTDPLVSVTASGVIGYPVDHSMRVLYSGVIGVVVNGTVAAGDAVYVVDTTADFGMFRNDDTNATLVTGAKFLEAGDDGDVVRAAFNLA